ncbi:MAG: FecR family protein [Proteobacteria bacterium]|jgi:hypothetical protein|nr:FecR family protein [Pseudomonadota bacterium]
MKSLFVVFFLLSFTSAWADKGVAVVKRLRGEVTVKEQGKVSKLKEEDWLRSGVTVLTADKSFVRITFTDKSQMNIGPNSEMKIEQFGTGDAGVLDLVKGKIRSQVSKDYLGQKDKDKSKLFIKTPNAVMGVRGTDFLISTNGVNSSAVLFEGEVVFNKIDNAALREISTNALESMVDRGVRIFPGEFSVVEANRPIPTVPSLMNVQQIETLEKNQDFSQERAPSDQGSVNSGKSVVPAGLSGTAVASSSSALDKELKQKGIEGVGSKDKANISDARGFKDGEKVKPTNGSYLHVDTGTVIAPSKDAVYDSNTNTFVADGKSGSVGRDGNYVPPKNVTITDSGKILASVQGQIVQVNDSSMVMGDATLSDVIKTISTTSDVKTITKVDNGTLVIDSAKATGLSTIPSREAPTLCATCAIQPSSATTKPSSSNVQLNTGVGDP